MKATTKHFRDRVKQRMGENTDPVKLAADLRAAIVGTRNGEDHSHYIEHMGRIHPKNRHAFRFRALGRVWAVIWDVKDDVPITVLSDQEDINLGVNMRKTPVDPENYMNVRRRK